jgi:uncharacterized protein (TIGR03086 family)
MAYRRAAEAARRAVAATPDDRWAVPSPCAEWTVRDVVNHLTYEQLWAPDVLGGRTIEEVGDRYDGDVVGSDPAGAFGAALDGALAAVDESEDLSRHVHLSYGDAPAGHYLAQMALDLAVHGWDVAAGSGQAYTVADDLAEWLLESARPMMTDEVRAMGIFADEVAVTEAAGAFDRLLGLCGRDPAWGG